MRSRLLLPALLIQGCFATATPVQRVTDAAREMNLATRFGQVAVASRHVDMSIQTDFLNRRAQWGKAIRVLDIELSGIHVADEEHATVTVDVAWSSVTDSLARATQLTQEWEYVSRGWLMVRERRVAGDTGLFGEVLPVLTQAHPDVHEPSRTIR